MRNLEEMLAVLDVGDLTLEETLTLNEAAISGIMEELLAGEIWKQRASGDSCKVCATVDQLLYSHGLATVAHYRLRYWTAQNGYATGLPLRTILQNYTLGSVLLRELIDQLSLAIEYVGDWRHQVTEEDNQRPLTK